MEYLSRFFSSFIITSQICDLQKQIIVMGKINRKGLQNLNTFNKKKSSIQIAALASHDCP
jgi:hypothetical protein